MKIDLSALKGFNNGMLTEKIMPPKTEKTTDAGVIIPVNAGPPPAHVFSRVLSVGWSCSARIRVGDLIVAEKAMNTTLKSPRGNDLQFVRENDVIGVIAMEDLPPELRLERAEHL